MACSLLEKFFHKIWYPNQGDVGSHILQLLLWPLSVIYKWIILCRYYFLKFKYRQKTNPVPVIVVGNLSVGGTGKTPFVVYLTDLLKKNGYVPGVISRGYGGDKRPNETLAVGTQSTPQRVGDEPYLIYQNTQCPVVVGARRNNSIEYMAKHYPEVNIIISDDGLQHYAMPREMEIVLIDGQRQLGNQHCLPAGPLREPVSKLKQADFIVVKNGEYRNATTMQIVALDLVNIKSPEQKCSISEFANQEIHAITGIGHAMSFFQLLIDQGARIIQHHFPDHHVFRAKDIILPDSKPVVMTEKDAIKCVNFVKEHHWMLPIQAKLPKIFETELLRKIDRG